MPGVIVAGDDQLRAVAATGLVATADRLPPEPLERQAWERLLGGVRTQRIQGLLAQAVSEGALPVTDQQRAEVAQLHRDAMSGVLRVEQSLVAAVALLRRGGVAAVVMKGSAAAHLDYPDPALRVFGDVDLLVPREALGDAVAVLLAGGYRRLRPELRRGFDRRFGKSIDLVDPDGVQIDLHRTLSLEPIGLLIDIEDLFRDLAAFRLGDVTLHGLSTTCRFVHACYHAVLGNHPVRLVPLRDAAGIMQSERFDRGAAIGLAESWRGGAVVARAVGLATRAFGLDGNDPLARWATDRAESRGERELLAPFGAEGRHQANRTLATLRQLDGFGTKIAYLRAILLPQRGYLRSRSLTRLRWLRRGTAALRATGGRG